MIDLQLVIDRLQAICFERKKQDSKLSMNRILIESGVGKDFVSNMKKGQTPAIDKFYMLADYLETSIDSLLGRDHQPNYTFRDITNSAVIQGTNPGAVINSKEAALSKESEELVKIFEKLDAKKRHKLMALAFELEED